MGPKVVVFDYGSGNVRSACRALEHVGAQVELTSDRSEALEARGLLVPGVGAFAAVMEQLRAAGGSAIIDARLAGSRPVFGVCVGLQVMFESSEEKGRAEGLGQWPGVVRRLDAPVVPHMGWSSVEAAEGSKLFEGVADERFYFVHSYGVLSDPLEALGPGPMIPPLVTWARHGSSRFVAAVENGPLVATQFHPEKSGEAGLHLLRNWLETL
ncbi:MAG: imidazole glycerol phosphate synthase subunit HisH [Schaalia hyovaginalis]|uniref:imidazole glycerol phosphate synthase subunit HisH n=1 Tax=Schaalia hyovaginalis TaxID=29316 RepID=UPI002A90AC06|nr:imidazole glycerol phosphate synthase subunit HisH [Schaalia hyovaginalis]MDY6213033.1 imidazole glycerol phosphate synthase subunit HisH [Schaalia hyovaginalis]